ncbi:hypothetical protein MalM25_08480 [Planctomycetes bacterium MalM25]|nr:hypothetical protein MalM25_08480 [Planctomycetes bacterium MalM25]
MIKQAMSEAGLAPLAVLGLMIFVAVFVGVALWAMTRGRRQVVGWSSLPLEDGARLPVIAIGGETTKASNGCGKCENCDCQNSQAVTPITINE